MKRGIVAMVLATLSAQPLAAEPERLPDGLMAKGTNDIAEVWLTRPTDRYAHGILGDAIEAGGLMVRTRDGETLELVLPEQFVFEDRQARIHDLDGDGRDEIIVVLTSVTEGGALAFYGVRDGKLVKLAQTPHIGRPNRWLNPAEIADLDGDGKLEIVFVTTPHLGKIVEVWRYHAARLSRVTTLAGYSNHVIGSPVQDMTEVVNSATQGRLLAIPAADYSTVAFLKLEGDKLAEVARVRVGGRITSAVTLNENGRRLEFATGQKKRSIKVP
jgi:hypothetical protein